MVATVRATIAPVRLFVAALLVRLFVAGAAWVVPRQLALRDYAANHGSCAMGWHYLNRRPECAVLAEDETAYDAIGRNIAAGRGFQVEQGWVLAQPGRPTAYGGFLYPAFVGAVYAAAGNSAALLVLIQCGLGALAVCGIAAAAGKVGGAGAARIAGIVGTVHPGLALDSAWVMSEALAVPLLVAAFLVWLRYLERPSLRLACAMGVTAAAACLTRSTAALALGTMAVTSVVGPGWRPAAAARHLAAALAVAALCVAPWAARNARLFGAFVPFDTKAGAGLWLNNHPSPAPYREAWTGELNPDPPPGPVPGLNEAQADGHFRRLTVTYAADHPATVAGVSAVRLGLALVPVPRYWGRWPLVRAIIAIFYVALTWLALAGLWRVRRGPAGRALIGFVVAWMLMMSATSPGLRHRLAAEWAFAVAASVALAEVLRRRAAGRRQPLPQSDPQRSAPPHGSAPPS